MCLGGIEKLHRRGDGGRDGSEPFPNPTHGFRPKVAEYTTKETIKVGVSITLANPQFGKGGGWQV